MDKDINGALQKLLRDKPQLLFGDAQDGAQEFVEIVHRYLYAGDGGGTDAMIATCDDIITEILKAAKEVPELREWTEKLDALAKTMYERAA